MFQKKCVDVFEGFYKTETEHKKKLKWVYSLGTCNVTGTFENQTIQLIVSTHQVICFLRLIISCYADYCDIEMFENCLYRLPLSYYSTLLISWVILRLVLSWNCPRKTLINYFILCQVENIRYLWKSLAVKKYPQTTVLSSIPNILILLKMIR